MIKSFAIKFILSNYVVAIISMCSISAVSAGGIEVKQIKKSPSALRSAIKNRIFHEELSFGSSTSKIQIDEDQSFVATVDDKKLVFASVLVADTERVPVMSCLLAVTDAEDGKKPNFYPLKFVRIGDELRPWDCIRPLGLSFSYKDGSINVISLYNMEPPSGESFNLPVITQYNLASGDFYVDEEVTKKMEDLDPKTISDVKKALRVNQ